MRNKFFRFTSVALSFLLLISQNVTLAEGIFDSQSSDLSRPTSDVKVLGEVESRRSEYTKHFRMSDGTMQAITYSDPVHYKDGDIFKEIDNSLVPEGTDKYKNTDSPFGVSVSRNFKNKNLITLSSDNHELSWSYMKKKYKKFNTEETTREIPEEPKAQPEQPPAPTVAESDPAEVEGDLYEGESSAEATQEERSESEPTPQTTPSVRTEIITKKTTIKPTQADVDAIPEAEQGSGSAAIENLKDKPIEDENLRKTSINKSCSKAKFASSDQDIDLDYTISGLSLKENIILNKKLDDNDRFDFICTTDLALTKDDNGDLVFADEFGKMIFTIPKGAMWDSNDATSTDIEYEFSPISGGYIISVLPNREWLESDERVYPITIDPSITKTLTSGFEINSASNGAQNTNWSTSDLIRVGTYARTNIYKGYIKCTALPTFGRGEIITNAQLRLKLPSDSSKAYMHTPDNRINVRSVAKPWVGSTMYYANAPHTDGIVDDYTITTAINTWYEWDITRMAQEWYSLPNPNLNNGIELSAQHEDVLGFLRFISPYSTDYPDGKPQMVISYKMFLGEEDYWSYTTTKGGYKGVSKVNNYAGTLSVSEDVLSYSGSRNPLSITNTYNNCSYNDQANGYVHGHVFANGYPHSSYTGLGFRLSFNKLIYSLPQDDPLRDTGYRYVYVDGDGTQHYFKLDNNRLADVDGLNLTLTESGNNIIEIKDLKENKLTFGKPYASDEAYVLLESSDNEGNITTYNYGIDPGTPGSKINTITDSAGRVTTISYNNNAMVSAITAADGKQIGFSYYDDGKLKEIAYPGDNENSVIKTGYNYDAQGRLSSVWTDAGVGSCVKYDYASNDYESTYFFKIRNITEYAGTKVDARKAGRSENFVYEMNQTKITHGINNNDVPYGKQTEIWQFDNEGQVTSAIDDEGNMIASTYYNETDGRRHKVKHTNDAGKYVNNLLKNTSAHDDLANWTVDNWIQSDAAPSSLVSIDTTVASLGEKSFKIARDNASDAPWPILRQRVKIQKKSYDRKFTFSGDIKLPSSLSGGEGASLHLASFGDNGQQMSGDGYSKWLTSETDWVRESVTINVPAGATEIECAFGLKESTGTALFDCLQLEESNAANDYNMVENSSFDNKLEKWDTADAPDAAVEDGRLRIIGKSEEDRKVSQTISVNKPNPVFAVRASSQGFATPNTDSKKYCIECTLKLSDNTERTVYVWFNPDVADTQVTYRSIFPADYKQQGDENKNVASIKVSPCFANNCNTVYFDNVYVYIDDRGMTYDRNTNGVPTKITDNTGSYENYTVNADNEVTQVKDARENQTDISYGNNDKAHRPTDYTVQNQNVDVKTTLGYDTTGNVTSSSTQKSDATGDAIQTATQYTLGGNYVSAEVDSRGKTTAFTVDENNGNITKVTNANNVETNCLYNGADRLESATCEGAQTSYSYLKGLISSVSHKVAQDVNTIYNFVRDMFGNISEVKIGDRLLAKNTYDAGNGLIRQTKYGNEQTVNYDYDDQGRVIKKSFGYGKGNKFGEFNYSYDDKGRISEVYDSVNDLTVKFEYDKFGRLLRTARSDGMGSEVTYGSFNSLINTVTSKIFETQTTLNNTFGKLDTLLSSVINIGGVAVSSVYDYGNDTLGRLLATEALNYDSTSGLRHEFNYLGVENAQNRTTNFINSVEIKKKVEGNWVSLGEKFNYTYDNLGNITDVTDLNNSLIAHYEYDDLNQLIRENNVQTGKTVTYQYNVGGNLTEKKTYSYTTDADLTNATLESTITYTYGDSNWPDKLTSITCGENEQAMIYDAIGNPLEYRDGWKCEWSRGHRLDKIENSGYNVNVTFKYNEGGIRNQKIVNGVQTDFITSGIKLLGQKTGENVLLWQVDGNDNTIGFNYNNIPYFYMKNLQGDIIGITDASGNIVAKYTYDSWGKLISIKDASDVDKTTDTTFIGYINPLRYRGYYYDSETGLYYLNARYYDPEIGRFINADETLDGGYNLFEYCYNNPIMFYDSNGCVPTPELLNFIKTSPDLRGDCEYAFSKTIEVGCVIYERNGIYEAGWRTYGKRSSLIFNVKEMRYRVSQGYNIAAFWHVHPFATDAFFCGLSQEDLDYARGRHAPIFAHTANGDILGFDPDPAIGDIYLRSTSRIRSRIWSAYLMFHGITEDEYYSALNVRFDMAPAIMVYSPRRIDARLTYINWNDF